MSQGESFGVISKLSDLLGTSEPALRLLLTILADVYYKFGCACVVFVWTISCYSKMSTTKPKKVWSKQDTRHIINLYATYGIPLWNTYLPENVEGKLRAIKQIALQMQPRGYDEADVKQKIRYIRTRYKQEVLKIRQNPQYRSKSFWFKQVHSFLRPHVNFSARSGQSSESNDSRTKNSVFVKPLNKKKDVSNVANTTNEDVRSKSIVSASVTFSNNDPSQNFRKTENLSVGITNTNNIAVIGPNSTVCETSVVAVGDKVFDIFGKSVASQLKVFPKDVAVEIQFRIQAILTDQTLLLDELSEKSQNN